MSYSAAGFTSQKNCPLCGSSQLFHSGKKVDQYLVKFNLYARAQNRVDDFPEHTLFLCRCQDCQIEFINPRLDDEKLTRFYELWYTREYVKVLEDPAHQAKRRQEFREIHHPILEKYLPKSDSIKLLDVGTGSGLFLESLDANRFDISAVEAVPEAATKAAEIPSVTIYQGDFLQMEIPSNHFDVLTLFDLLEHVTKPVDVLKRAAELLTEKGLLVLRVPDRDSWQAKLSGEEWSAVICDHLYYFNRASLTSALEASGFEIIEMHAGPSYPFFRRVKEKILLLWQRINRRLLHKNPRPQTDATLDVYDTIHLGFSKSVLKDYLKAEMLDWVDIASGYFNRGNMVFVVARKR